MFVEYQKCLILYGLVVYLVSLILGVGLGKFKNPRMALSTHVTGLMVGIFSLVLAAVAQFILLSQFLASITFYLHVVGNTLLVLSLGLAAHWNTQSKTPIAGAKELGSATHESLVKFGIVISSFLLIVSCLLLIFGAA